MAKHTEQLRRSFRPANIKILFLGESPPAGGGFFYDASRTGNLSHYTHQAFSRFFGVVWNQKRGFLDFFREHGCYLDDLCLGPVNDLPRTARRQERSEAVPSLAQRMRTYNPRFVLVTMKGIRKDVEAASEAAGLHDVAMSFLPFPSNGRQKQYVEGLVGVLDDLAKAGIMSTPSPARRR